MSTIQINGADFYYELAGSGPPVVLLHAGIADSRMWDRQFDAFVAAGHTVLRYDQRGYGRTAPVPGSYIPREDLRVMLKALGIERPSLVGCARTRDGPQGELTPLARAIPAAFWNDVGRVKCPQCSSPMEPAAPAVDRARSPAALDRPLLSRGRPETRPLWRPLVRSAP